MSTTQYKYVFEKTAMPKGDCPSCDGRKVFRYYEGLPREFGKCERVNNCGYHNKPNGDVKPSEVPKVEPKPQVYVDAAKVETWVNNQTSNFHHYALGLGITPEHLRKWNIGTTERKETVYVFVNAQQQNWNAKFFQYTEGGSRSKDVDAYSMKATKDGRYLMCLFGEHLLSDDMERRVCIVESEKTAVIASFFYPDYDFVSCGSNQGLTEEKVGVLVSRRVWNLRDADIAGRSTCSLKKLEGCATPLQCANCKIPAIEKRLIQWNISYMGLDVFPDNEDGYDLADSIKDGVLPNLGEVEQRMIEQDFVAASPNGGEAASDANEDDDTADGLFFEVSKVGSSKPSGDFEMWWNKLPHGISYAEIEEYGFYEHGHKYFMRRMKKDEIIFSPVSNFTMRVLFLIQGQNPKRIVEITNNRNKVVTIDFMINELISLDAFKFKVESQGNFVFSGTSADIIRIKQKLFDKEKASSEIAFAGHHKDQLYTFSNGVYDYKQQAFFPLNDHKMVDIDGKHYFVPLLEGNGDEEENANFKCFQYRPTAHTFETWSKLFIDVYGDNGRVGLAFGLMAIFLDVVKEITVGKYPMLFLFGQKGSGKTSMAKSLMCLFGERKEPPKLEGKSTPKSYMRQLAQLANSIFTLDEYKNSIHPDLIGMLKGLHDGEGYTRARMDNTNKTFSTQVRSTAIVGGQEMPNVEPALFSRFLLLEYQTLKNTTQKQRDAYDALVQMEDDGITSVLLEILSHREHFKATYPGEFKNVRNQLRKAYAESETIDRQILIGAAIMAAFTSMEKVLKMPFVYAALLPTVEVAITRQTALMNTSDEVQHFFETIGLLLRQGAIRTEQDVKFKDINFTQTGDEKVAYTEGWFLIRMKCVYPLYREKLIRQNMKPLDAGTLERYLKSSSAYDLKQSAASHRFRSLQNPTSALCFLQKRLVELYKLDLTEYAPNRTQDIDNQEVAVF